MKPVAPYGAYDLLHVTRKLASPGKSDRWLFDSVPLP